MRYLLFISMLMLTAVLSAQNLDTKFGKNRVQYHDDFKYWSKYETNNFIVYWYGKSKSVAQSAGQLAELDHEEIRKIIEHKITDKIEILVYVDINDVKQSNIGNEDLLRVNSGETTIVGNKMFVYFDGNHHHLRQNIREGIASVYLASMMFGSNFQEILQNAVLLDVPLWYQKGIISYAANNWNILVEDELRDIVQSDDKYYDFEKIAIDHPSAAGHSLWNYIATSYGKSSISNLLYLTKISRDVENSFLFVLNTPLQQIYEEWEDFYRSRFESEEGKFALDTIKPLKLKKRGFVPVSSMEIDSSDRYLLYVQNDIGKSTVRLRDLNTGKDKKIFKKGFKNGFQATDYDFPRIAWHPNQRKFTILYQHRDRMYLRRYEVGSEKWEEQIIPETIQRIYSLDYIDDRHYLFSAAMGGVSDIVLYDSKYRVAKQITNDFYDDLDASYTTLDGQKGIIFTSNRPVDHILPAKLDSISPLWDFDILFYPFEITEDEVNLKDYEKVVDRITNTNNQNERQPLLKDGKHLIYLSDKSGIINTYVYDLTRDGTYAISNHSRNIIIHSLNAAGSYLTMKYLNGSYEVFLTQPDLTIPQQVFTSTLVNQVRNSNDKILEKQEEEKKNITINPGLFFQSKFPDPEVVEEIEEENEAEKLKSVTYPSITISDDSENKKLKFKSSLITAAGLKFKLANLTTRFDNEVLFEGLELADGQGNNPGVNQVPMGFLAKATMLDIFEDHILEGGIRIPTNLNGAEYFLVYDRKKKLIDRRVALYRRTQNQNTPSPDRILETKINTLLALYQWKYPFDIYTSLSATTSFRNDRSFVKSTDDVTFNSPEVQQKRLGFRLEYIYDNTFDYDINIKHGTRYKVFLEGFNQFNFEFVDGWNVDLSNGLTGLVGFDARHYVPVLKHSVLAMRGAGGLSFGSRPNLYFLGNVNNSIFNTFNNDVPIRNDIPFAFKNNVNQMRGFRSNIRNGTRFAVSNVELRIPIFKYLLGKNKGLAFFRNMQFTGFFDAGLAWYGSSPFSEENPLNSIFIDNPVAQIEVEYFRDPLVMGFGWGVRTQVLGYFIKLDVARGIETRQIQDRIYHISFGQDF